MSRKIRHQIMMLLGKNKELEEFVDNKDMIMYVSEHGKVQIEYIEHLDGTKTYSLIYKYSSEKLFLPLTRYDNLNSGNMLRKLDRVLDTMREGKLKKAI